MPKVSVIIPTYNRLPVVKEAVDSVLAQDFEDFELIVVDDGSTDGTAEEIKRYGGRVRLLPLSQNRGVSVARNRGILQARSKYVAFLDSDDLWVKGKLKTQVLFLEDNPQYPLCYTDEIWIRRGKRVNPKLKHTKYSGWIFEKCLPLCIISPSSALMHREIFAAIGCFDPAFPVCEDYDLWLRVAARWPIFFIPQHLIIKRGGHPDQLSRQPWGNDRYRVKALVKIMEQGVLTAEQQRLTIQELHRKLGILISGFRKRGKDEEVKEYQTLLAHYPL